jgi:hypothetical protein
MSKTHTLNATHTSPAGGSIYFRFVTHPLILLASWSLVLISGEHTGGPYIMYLFLGFPKAFAYSVLGYITILILLLSVIFIKKKSPAFGYPMLNLMGSVVSFVSITAFFIGDKTGYNYGTFYSLVPLITVAVYLTILALFNYRYIKELS